MHLLTTWELEELGFDTLADKPFRQLGTLSWFPASVNALYHNQSTPSNLSRHEFIYVETTHTHSSLTNMLQQYKCRSYKS